MSVVIPCRNAAATVGEQLGALGAQDYGGPLEVIVADNGSTDGSADVAGAWSASIPSLRVIDASESVGGNHARNRGAAAAQGELILTCDADDVVGPGWVAAMVRGLADHDLVGGRIDFTALNDGLPTPAVAGALPVRFGFLPAASGGNFGIRAEVLRTLGGWKETGTCHDDVELVWRAQLAGFRLGYAPDAVVQVRLRSTTPGAVRQAYANARSLAPTVRDFLPRGLPWEAVLARGLGFAGRILIGAPGALVDARRRREWLRMVAVAAGFARGLVGR